MKRKREDIIDQAIEQTPAAPQPVSIPQAATVPIDPLTPPQPGMVPIGWMWPQQGAVAQAMDTGDVEMGGLAPDGGVIEPDTMGEEDIFTDEDKEVIEEYRKWKAKRVKEEKRKKIKEEAQIAADSDVIYLMKELDISEEAAAVIASWYSKEQVDVEDMSQDELYDDVWSLLDASTNRDEYLTVLKSFDPDGYAEEIAEDMGLGEDEDMYTDEEKKVIEEYRKWKKNPIKERKLKEEDEDLEMEPTMPEEVELTEPPVEGDFDDELLDDDFMEELGEIVIDINDLFADLGGDLESFMPEDEMAEDDLDLPVEEIEDVEEEVELDELVEKKAKRRKEVLQKYKRKQEAIKYPAGDIRREEEDPSELVRTREAQERRRELVQKLRRKREMDAQEIAADATQDPDVLDKEAGFDSVQSVIDKIGESRIKQFKQQEAYDKKFLERYEEKKQLNWKKLLENGLLG